MNQAVLEMETSSLQELFKGSVLESPEISVWEASGGLGRRDAESPNAVSQLDMATTIKSGGHSPDLERDSMNEQNLSPLELKRLRNRECMRRSRRRKQDEINTMKQEIAELEAQVHKLQIQKQSQLSTIQTQMTALAPADTNPNDPSSITQLQQVADAIQQENFELRDEIRSKQKFHESIALLLEQEEQRQQIDNQEREFEKHIPEQFSWLQYALPVLSLRSFSPLDVTKLVQESCALILSSAGRADSHMPNSNRVLGWTDKRIVDDKWVQFIFGKDFIHEDLESVVAKSWEVNSNIERINVFQPRLQSMVLLQRWDEDTVVIARNLFVPDEGSDGTEIDLNFCTVMLLFRLKTAHGYIIGTRSLMPETINDSLRLAGEYRTTCVHLCYGLLFTPLAQGFNVKFGGRGGNANQLYVQVCAMDALLAILRWENFCIAPLNRIGMGDS
ncbi:hypothetical protein Poli38472_007276 [Pythium oligandrum]|uniref:BZIP domain-containing protein n=1 Tax=Pythium oligandrum TaxID=41045 RepID=A0A8K1FE79_PYTOL|nr:hypothetical protein Poli38472_007276 [Pythium oligandrum]|eukprot:TMW59131.1 hypothetical protein Poli38472_007276 [Pythium oligandrum]